MRVLIVEDEIKVADFISRGLRESGYAVDVAYDGEEGLSLALQGNYDLLILDVMLPGRDGFQILEAIRRVALEVRVLMLTALDQTQNKVKGLNLGSDDYLTKPFEFDELLARVNALLRRGNYDADEELKAADLVLDTKSMMVTRGRARIELTNREFMLLKFLLENKNEVVTRTMIAQHVWNLGLESNTNVIDVYINYLRRKIDAGQQHKLIQTIRGRGYMLTDVE